MTNDAIRVSVTVPLSVERAVRALHGGPRLLVPDPAKASEVEVSFVEEDAAVTRVDLEHRGFARHGEEGDAYRQGMGSPQGWPYMLERYVEQGR